MSMWRPLFLRCMILDHKLQRMLNDSKIAQLNSERPLHQTAVLNIFPQNMVIKVSVSDNLVSSYRSWYDILSQLHFCRARMSSNVFGIFLSMNLLVAQKKIVNIPLDQECKGTEFLFCVTRGILFRLASPYSEPNRRKGFFVDQCTLD